MSLPHIVVLDDFERASGNYVDLSVFNAQAKVVVHTSPLAGDALIAALLPADVVVMIRDRTPFKKNLIDQLPNLKYVVFTGGRNGLIDMDALNARGIPVSHTEFGPSKEATAELTIALLMASFKRLDRYLQTAGSGAGGSHTWRPGDAQGRFVMPRLLSGATLGLIGLGAIGAKVAHVASAMGMKVQAWSPNMTDARATAHGVTSSSLDHLLATSDAVSLHLVLAPSTRHIVGAAQLAKMKSGAVLINTARSGLVDEIALAQSLNSQHIAAAAVDVFDTEPVPSHYPLTQVPNLISTPHLGFVCEPVYQNFWSGIHEALTAWLSLKTSKPSKPLPRPYQHV
jgi:phosphoglycerate dehydrogenase-like enzyme